MSYKRHKRRIFLFLLLVATTVSTALILTDNLLSPVIKAAASQRAKSYATYIISEAVCNRLSDDGINYSDIVSFEKDAGGKITALKTDTVRLNHLKSRLSSDIYLRLSTSKNDELSVPLGAISGSPIFSSIGPAVKVRILSVGSVVSDFENIFTSAGINQTNHRIMINVKLSFNIAAPFKPLPVEVSTSVCAAESVILGDVPEAFTNVQNFGYSDEGETVADEVVDFGAHNFLK